MNVQTICHKEYVVAVKHDQRWEILQYWLGVLFQDVQGEVHYAKFLRQKVALQWLKQSSYPLTYTPGDACNGNSLISCSRCRTGSLDFREHMKEIKQSLLISSKQAWQQHGTFIHTLLGDIDEREDLA